MAKTLYKSHFGFLRQAVSDSWSSAKVLKCTFTFLAHYAILAYFGQLEFNKT